ncbi:MtaA/CmuA family methyltransferase [Neomoorella thermoacetica]|uniref:MtaA/CmuA family methyltransferase n=1 Tax=Neomoorella thermoacetica TaxID=1525 RepID=UPI00091404A6|nr:MtaA/CmuA family methyltransferase [Moorella thermoacetica]OIQ62537.1 uroporphyrinogen decarboxylase [Moorella thermoacetica]
MLKQREWMTPKRRFLSALFGGRVDRAPVANPTSLVTVELMERTGAYFPDAHLDAEKMARLAATSYEVLGFDTIMPVFSAHTESAALGVPVDWGDKMSWPVNTSHPITDPEQIVIPDSFLEEPSMRTVLDAIKILRSQYGDRVAIIGKTYGPWSLAYHLVGTENFLMETILNPDKARRYLEVLLEASLLSAKAQIKAGADAILWGDHATGDLVSAEYYRDFLMKVHQYVTREVGAPIILHICGNTTKFIPYIVEAGFDAFHFDSKVDAKLAKELAGNKMSLIGNINNPVTLLAGTPEDVKKETLYAIEAGVEIVGPECAIPLTTPLENILAITETAKEYQIHKKLGGETQ